MPKLLIAATAALTLRSFLLPHARSMREGGWTVDGAARGILEDEACKVAFDSRFEVEWGRDPRDALSLARSYRRIRQIVRAGRYDIVHVHTPVAAAVTRFALKNFGATERPKVIYTAHGFHFFSGAPLKNWLLFYPVEKYLSRFTELLITINTEDYVRARGFAAKRVEYLPGVGVDVARFQDCREVADRSALGVPEGAYMLLSAGELNANKNHAEVLRALARIGDREIHYVIAGDGPLRDELRSRAAELGVGAQLHLAGYRHDMPELYRSADCFVFPSKREGLPVALMEAAASGLPLICSRIRGSIDVAAKYPDCRLYESGDTDALAALLRVRPKRGENGTHSLPEEIFGLRVATEASARLYKELLGS
ncbi:MAG: glycosyltransferase [Synergistes jonesii]|uniref:glycosyltransferase n=1 Tax=Synergistes jonesii TaxID=2754 RepID=UPI002A75A95D|nr:glycosyltransferase [Synergistes jonesii]MDY2984332.1 glycosyltransferase [Synergistes jonesii]